MFIIESYSIAVIFCLITMVCWGSWANTQKLAAANWWFELFYWDYVLGIVLLATVFALTLGSLGSQGRSFWPDLQQASITNIGSAYLGGVIFNAANILLGAAISIAGMSVAFPVGIGLALVIGVVVNYIDQPVGQSTLLFSGVGFIVIAIVLNATAYRQASAYRQGVSGKGLLLAVVSGAMMGLFYKYVAQAMFPDFAQPQPGKLSPYSAVLLFSLGILASNLVFNTLLMYRPFVGAPVSYGQYWKGNRTNHVMGILGGIIWCIGMSFNILASDKAGPAISYGLGQGATVIAAIWGIYVWNEFKGAPSSTQTLLRLMLGFYVVGLGLIIAAR
ncbi:GRP family sugar transporter (plasmid) [Spirosoma sp. SC4-14]|uniref:GRP family sugar transporter n=1 Tax=Spirosoma sp. SC4-14 TaxID=3128900 RepID=UPI0030CC423B